MEGQRTDIDRTRDVAGAWDELNRDKCDSQLERDMFQCQFVANYRFRKACEDQATSRHTACMKNNLLPPFSYYS